MRQNDVAVIILVVAISLMASYFIGSALIASPESRSKQVEVIQPIGERFVNYEETETYGTIFNGQALNPSLNIDVGENNTTKPFIETQN